MSVARVWFPNAPSGNIDSLQRSQIAVGISLVSIGELTVNYLRRYLDDPLSIDTPSPITPAVGTENSDTSYLRRYLNDIV